jgi:hypothetical protein
VPTGSVVGWGSDYLYRYGYPPEYTGQATPPDAVNGVSGTATDVAAGGEHSCAIRAGTGNVVCWGSDYSQAPGGTNFYSGQATPPDAVNGVSGTATHIAAGSNHSCAIQAGTGNVVCWGRNLAGVSTPPDTVNGVSGTATHIAAGSSHNCAIQAGTGNVVCWGYDHHGQATPPDFVGTAAGIAAGSYHSCAIKTGSGYVVCWGDDRFGQVSSRPEPHAGLVTASDIAAGIYHSCAIQAGTGNAVCWGYNRSGQSAPPDAVNGVSGTASDIAAGGWHSCAIQSATGEVVCWGNNSVGQSAPPDAVNGVSGTATDIAVGSGHTLAIVRAPSDCLCEVQNINPNQVVLQNVGTGGKGSDGTRKMTLIVRTADAPGASCDPGEFSAPAPVNLKMADDRGNILIDNAKVIVCEQGVTTNLEWNVSFQGPLNCENGAVPPPKPGFSLGRITSTGSAPGTADYVESTKIKCFE